MRDYLKTTTAHTPRYLPDWSPEIRSRDYAWPEPGFAQSTSTESSKPPIVHTTIDMALLLRDDARWHALAASIASVLAMVRAAGTPVTLLPVDPAVLNGKPFALFVHQDIYDAIRESGALSALQTKEAGDANA